MKASTPTPSHEIAEKLVWFQRLNREPWPPHLQERFENGATC